MPQSSQHTDSDAKMDTISDQRPFERFSPYCIIPSTSHLPRLRSSTNDSVHLPAQKSTPVVKPSNSSTDPADDSMHSRLFSNLKAMVSEAYRAKDAVHKAAMDQRQAAWEAAVGRANHRANEAEQALEKERAQHLALISSNKRCLDELAIAKLAAEQSAKDAAAVNSVYGELAELGSEWEANLAVNGQTILDTETAHMTKEQELKLRNQIRKLLSYAQESSSSVRTGSGPHETTPSSHASQISNMSSIHPEQPSTSARIDEHLFCFDGVCLGMDGMEKVGLE